MSVFYGYGGAHGYGYIFPKCGHVNAGIGLSPGRGLLLLRARHPLLHLTREVRRQPDHALQHHQLRAVMHLVFFHGHQNLEP